MSVQEVSQVSNTREFVQLSVRVPAELVNALSQVAKEEDRTVSAELRRAIRCHVGDDRIAQIREVAAG
jgi:predicted transcriptional regulator